MAISMDTWTSHSYVVLLHPAATMLEAHNCLERFLCWIVKNFPSLELRGLSLLQHENVTVRKGWSMKIWSAKVSAYTRTWESCTELWPQAHWTPLRLIGMTTGPRLFAGHWWLTSIMLLWLKGKIPTTALQSLMESLPWGVVVIITTKGDELHINAHGFRMGCSVSTNFRPCCVCLCINSQ